MGKPTICLDENKSADQLHSNCTGRFMSDLVGNHIVGFPTRRLIIIISNAHNPISMQSPNNQQHESNNKAMKLYT